MGRNESGKKPGLARLSGWRDMAGLFALAIVMTLVLLACVYAIYNISQRMHPDEPLEGVKFSTSAQGGVMKIAYGSNSLSMVDVPAYKFWTPTGVRLVKGSAIRISATGIVSTVTPLLLLKNARDDRREAIGELQNKLLALEMEKAVHAGWRDPNGQPLSPAAMPNAHVDDCAMKVATKAESTKLDRAAEYGALLGFVVRDSLAGDVDELLGTDKIETVELGTNAEIRYDAPSNRFVVTSDLQSKPQYIPAYDENEMLYLTVNDTVVHNEFDLDYPCKVASALEEARERQKEIYKMMHKPKYIGYLDNSGSFRVTLSQEPVRATY